MRKIICICIIIALLLPLPLCLGDEMVYTCASVVDSNASYILYPDFDEAGELSVLVPGLNEGFVPQGIAYIPAEHGILFSGYIHSGDRNSVLLEVDQSTGEMIRQIKLNNVDGTPYFGHAGGVCATENDIYLSDQNKLFRISLEKWAKTETIDYCSFEEEIPVPVRSDFCNYADGILWVGEFETKSNTDPSHWVKTKDGEQYAWACGYKTVEGQNFLTPDYILSIPYRIQGMTTLNGKIYLSQSYHRRNDSLIFCYRDILSKNPDSMVEMNDKKIPLWILDRKNPYDTLKCPPMSEGLCTIDGYIYVVFESAGERYMDPSRPSLNPIDRVCKFLF